MKQQTQLQGSNSENEDETQNPSITKKFLRKSSALGKDISAPRIPIQSRKSSKLKKK